MSGTQTAADSSEDWDAPLSGSALAGSGIASFALIPVPGTRGLVLSLRPPPLYLGSTTAVFIRNPSDQRYGKPSLRLDYGINKSNGRIDYHWNIDRGSVRQSFPNITNHMSAGRAGKVLYESARAFRVAGRVFVVVGAYLDGTSILVASRPFRRSLQVASAWGGAYALAPRGGAIGAEIGTLVEPGVGTAVGGFLGAAVGGFIGYIGGNAAMGVAFDWAAGTHFLHAPEVPMPQQ